MRPSHADLAVERAELDNFLDAVGGMILTASIRDFALREGQRRAARSRARGHADTVLRAFAEAYREIIANVRAKAPQATVAGIVVQEMVSGGVEMIAGLSQCAPFGMGIVTGTGGVLVELVKDASLALAPIDHGRALELIASTRANKLLEGFRGAQPADVEAFAAVLVALSGIATAYGDLLEAIDLNPVSVLPTGHGVRVLDALILPNKPSH